MKKIAIYLLFTVQLMSCTKDLPTKPEDLIASKITLEKTELSIKPGESYSFQVSHFPSEAPPPPSYTWKSNNESAVRVTDNGTITAIDAGEAIITVEAENNGHHIVASCKVTVSHIYPTQIKLNTNSLEIVIGKIAYLNYTILPVNATERNVLWESDNQDIVSVDQTGFLIALSIGSANIKISGFGEVSDVCEVIVKPVSVTGVKIMDDFNNELSPSIDIVAGLQKEIYVVVLPENAGNKDVVFESTNTEVAFVEKTGDKYYIMAKNPGTATITVKAVDGNYSRSFMIKVHDSEDSILFDKSLEFVVGTEGSSHTGFYSTLSVKFCPNIAGIVEVKELKITDNTGFRTFIYEGLTLPAHHCYFTAKIITAIMTPPVLQTYFAIGWKAEVRFVWNGKEHNISKINQ